MYWEESCFTHLTYYRVRNIKLNSRLLLINAVVLYLQLQDQTEVLSLVISVETSQTDAIFDRLVQVLRRSKSHTYSSFVLFRKFLYKSKRNFLVTWNVRKECTPRSTTITSVILYVYIERLILMIVVLWIPSKFFYIEYGINKSIRS